MIPVPIPLINPNEPEALLAGMHVVEGQLVAAGEPLCTLETTKSTADLVAEVDGYVMGLRFGLGQTVRAGELLCFLAASLDEALPAISLPDAPTTSIQPTQPPAGLRITDPALELARRNDLDLSRLPIGPLVTEKTVRAFLEAGIPGEYASPASAFDPQGIIIYGGGGHGKSLIDLLRVLSTYQIAGIVDDGIPAGQVILGVPVLGGADTLPGISSQGVHLAVNAVGGIGDVAVRMKVFHVLADAHFACPPVIHPSAVVEPSARLSAGVQIFAHAYVGSEAQIGYGAIVNTGAIVSHDCGLGNYANISPGAMLAGGVQVGDGALVGMGATINLAVRIGAGARIGNGATIKADVPERGVVRAGSIWPVDRSNV
jgi:sugar O-acyltransferase (sialic acid O-acetyltransferase NeuD family)